MMTAAKQRRELAKMSDWQLQDIGIDRAEALAEASRPAWDLPHAQVAPMRGTFLC